MIIILYPNRSDSLYILKTKKIKEREIFLWNGLLALKYAFYITKESELAETWRVHQSSDPLSGLAGGYEWKALNIWRD